MVELFCRSLSGTDAPMPGCSGMPNGTTDTRMTPRAFSRLGVLGRVEIDLSESSYGAIG